VSWSEEGRRLLRHIQTGYVVTEADVTAHEAALTITESQISDLDKYDVATADATFAPISHTHVEADITDLDKYSQAEIGELINDFVGPGTVTGGVVTDGGSGTVDITEWNGWLRETDDDNAMLSEHTISASTGVALTDNALNFIYADYNGGTPQFSVYLAPQRLDRTQTILAAVYRAGTEVHITSGKWASNNLSATYGTKSALIHGIERESGLVPSETGTRQVAITTGNMWIALQEFTWAAYDSSVTNFTHYYYQDGVGGWSEVTATGTIDNTQYDDGSGTLATLTNNRYGVHWVYIGLDGDVYVIYGQDDYQLAGAEEASPPAELPPNFNKFHTFLVGKIIIQKNDTTFTDVQTPYTVTFNSAAASDHGNLAGLADDDHPQYSKIAGTEQITGTWTFDNDLVLGSTTASDRRLDVVGDGGVDGAYFTNYGNVNNVRGRRAGGTEGTPTKTLDGDVLLNVNGAGYNDAEVDFTGGAAAVTFVATEDFDTAGYGGGELRLITHPNAGTPGPVTRMIVGSEGDLTLYNATTVPSASATDGVILYAEDVSASSELKVRDEAGNITTLSPHNFSLIPEGPSEEMSWAYYSEKNGRKINVDMLKLARMVEQLTGEQLVYEEQV